MESGALSLLTTVLFLPLLGVFVLLFLREEQKESIKWTAFGFSLATFFGTLLLWLAFDSSASGLQMVQRVDWLPQYNISYYVGIDGPEPAAGRADRLHHAAGDPEFVPQPRVRGARSRPALLRLHVAAGMVDDWRVHRPGPLPFLHFLGSDAGADVLPHRHLGRGAARLCGDQVLPLHHGRLDSDAAGDSVPRQPRGHFRPAGAGRDGRKRRAGAAIHRSAKQRQRAVLPVPGLLRGLRHQGAPFGHCTAGCRTHTCRRPQPARSSWPACC